ncbi:flavodoxin family protein [Nocardioides panacihumi]|uniref:Flavodoxin family protein n=1 Tax=Nocardioides panacihumi TaxID=400774 RepID=A0ABN2RTJ1_9ACTN
MTFSGSAPRTAVVYESMFGNTAAVAAAVARALEDSGAEVVCTDVGAADEALARETDLLVLGAPTHAFSLSRANSRAGAVRQGADPSSEPTGLREWISTLQAGPSQPRVATFDTRAAQVSRLPLGAAPTAARLARRRGFHVTQKPMTFVVEGTKGPLRAGELERAAAWGRSLAETVRISTSDQEEGSGR